MRYQFLHLKYKYTDKNLQIYEKKIQRNGGEYKDKKQKN